MNVTFHASALQGTITAPSSKSVFQRVVAASLLAEGTTRIGNPCFVNDGVSALAMAGALGATIDEDDNGLVIEGGFNPRQDFIEPGESGLGIRLFSPIAALSDQPIEIIAHGSLNQRPMDVFEAPFDSLGVSFKTTNGTPPLMVHGPMKSGFVQVDGSLSSQFVSGLLMALATLEGDSELIVKNPVSLPYIDMTLEVLEKFGIDIVHKDHERYTILGGQKFLASDVTIPGDWSGGAMLLVAAAIAGDGMVKIDGLNRTFTQADEAITGAMLFAGCRLANDPDGIRVTAHKIRGLKFDATHCPDLFPPLAAMAAFAESPSVFTGLHRLKAKESDRGQAIQQEFAKAGIQVDLDYEQDTMTVHPGIVRSCTIDSHNDHRIAMAGALLAVGSTDASITIEGIESIAKSYPEFVDDMADLGAQIG